MSLTLCVSCSDSRSKPIQEHGERESHWLWGDRANHRKPHIFTRLTWAATVKINVAFYLPFGLYSHPFCVVFHCQTAAWYYLSACFLLGFLLYKGIYSPFILKCQVHLIQHKVTTLKFMKYSIPKAYRRVHIYQSWQQTIVLLLLYNVPYEKQHKNTTNKHKKIK